MSKGVENRKGKKINNPHDAFIGKILRSKPEAESLLKGVLPQELIDVVDLHNIKLLPDTYLNNVI